MTTLAQNPEHNALLSDHNMQISMHPAEDGHFGDPQDHIELRERVSFLHLFQQAMTNEEESLQKEHIPLFADKENGILHPRSGFMRVWTVLMVIMVVVTAIVVPYEVAFLEPAINALFVLNRVLDVFFFADIVIQFFCAYYDSASGLLIAAPAAVKKHYARTTFVFDVLGIFPYEVVALATHPEYPRLQVLRLLKLFKMVRLFRLRALLVSFELDYSIRYDRLMLLGIVCTLVYLAHFVACCIRIVALVEDADFNWMTEMGVENAPAAVQYIAAFYYSAAVISNIGFSGVLAFTSAEQLFSSVVMLISAVLYAMVVATSINIMLSMRRDAFDQNQTLNDLNKFLSANKLPQPLRIRVRRYFQQVFRFRVITRTQEQLLMRRMSPELRGLCARHMGDQWMSDVPFLKSMSTPLIAELFVTLRLQTFVPRELIFGAEDTSDRMFILRRGSVFVRSKLLTPNKCFGEEMILNHAARRGYSAQALQYVETYVLLRKELMELLDGKPEVLKSIRRDVIKMAFGRCAREAVQRMTVEAQRTAASGGATDSPESPTTKPSDHDAKANEAHVQPG